MYMQHQFDNIMCNKTGHEHAVILVYYNCENVPLESFARVILTAVIALGCCIPYDELCLATAVGPPYITS